MKRLIICILCVAIVFSLCSCKDNNVEIQEPVNFYYTNMDVSYNTSTGVICPEIRDAVYFDGNLFALMEEYIEGPATDQLSSPLPVGTQLIAVERINDIVYVTFNKSFAALSGIHLSTAGSCILMTLNDYADITQVNIKAESAQLDNKDVLIMTMSDIVLKDNLEEKG